MLFRRRSFLHQLADGFEDDPEPDVVLGVFSLESFDLVREVLVRGKQLSEPDERSHDRDIYFDGLAAANNAGELCNTLLGKGSGTATQGHSRGGLGDHNL